MFRKIRNGVTLVRSFVVDKKNVLIKKPLVRSFRLNPFDWRRKYQLQELILSNPYPHTPDAAAIQCAWRHPVFICDDHMRNRPMYSKWGVFREYAQYRGRGFTEALFNGYWCFSEQRAIFLPNTRQSPLENWSDQTSAHPMPVLGEVFTIPSAVLFKLDNEMKNGYDFIRTTITVKIWCAKNIWTPFGNKRVRTPFVPKRIEAFMYVANPAKWVPDNGYDYKPLMIYPAKDGIQPDRFVYHSLRRKPFQT